MKTALQSDPYLFALPSPSPSMSKADDAHYELLRLALEVSAQNGAVGGPVAARTRETALHAVGTARRAAVRAQDAELHQLCDEAEKRIGPAPEAQESGADH
ncbi:MAG TPA: hypothetical protein VG796_28045 [Verrucomicrobiales bacterium]|nr:hypothetical protein [Verrucomicrobiales bacterium]